ncbi:hypothetical protein CDL12_25994 [Handroanthus impetiginosus]|uniref:Ubiquitin-like domain-containing protein n=1 Tax=Handroanthus impetiginosus TaxID=429701 RepID=A0A2G9G879_9LAMI|nr:hypothetical protein CDL12_25994 [Handroanthus impetiginosus]
MVKVLQKTKNKNRPTKILIPFSLQNKSLTYLKLPEPLLRLSVLKLDGSSFSFHVARNATVGRLKSAIEEEFGLSWKDERKNLWSLVWSHFCLCYEGQKLISEKACIQKYGIKDGDQLHFIQHLRIELAPAPLQSKHQITVSKQRSATKAQNADANHHVTTEDQYVDLKRFPCQEDLAFPVPKSKLTHSLKELLSCSKAGHSKRKAWERWT